MVEYKSIYGVEIPVKTNIVEFMILADFKTNKLVMEWNGETLYKKRYMTENGEVKRKFQIDALRNLMDKKYLYTVKTANGNKTKFNSELNNYVVKDPIQVKDVSFMGSKITVLGDLIESVPKEYAKKAKVTQLTKTKFARKYSLSDINKQFLYYLLTQGVYTQKLMVYDGVYFSVGGSKGIYAIDTKYVERVYKDLLKTREQVAIITKDSVEKSTQPEIILPKNTIPSIRKIATVGLDKFKFGVEVTKEEKVKKMLDFYVKHVNYVNQSEEVLLDYLNTKIKNSKEAEFITVEKYENKEVAEKFLNATKLRKYLAPNKKDSSIPELVFYKGFKSKEVEKNENVLLVILTTKKLEKNLLHAHWSMPKEDKTYADAITAKTDFSKLYPVGGVNSLGYYYALREIEQYVDLTDEEREAYRILYITKAYTPRNKVYRDDVYESLINKMYLAFTRIYIVATNEANELKRKNSTESYARSYEDKKNIGKKTLKAMEDSKFKGEIFKYVEIDDDVNLDKYYELEKEFLKTVPILPKVDSPLDLRFRKLGNIRVGGSRGAGGVYFDAVKTLAIDLDNLDSFVHEYGHAIDFNNGKNGQLSLEKEFLPLVNYYSNELIETADFDTEKLNYYCENTEVFARAFEVYMSTKIKNSNLGKQDFEGKKQYQPLEEIKSEVINYFDNLLGK